MTNEWVVVIGTQNEKKNTQECVATNSLSASLAFKIDNNDMNINRNVDNASDKWTEHRSWYCACASAYML